MVSIGRLDAEITADSSRFRGELQRAEAEVGGLERALGSFGGSLGGLATAAAGVGAAIGGMATAAVAAVNRLEELSVVVGGEQSIARAFGLTRQEYVALATAIAATGQEREEVRDLLGDLQELAGLAARPGASEAPLLREIGIDASFAAQASEDLIGAFRVFLGQIAELDRVAARGLLSEAVGADASRRFLEVAAARDQLEASLGRQTGTIASDAAATSLVGFGQAVREARQAVKESAVEFLSATGALEDMTQAVQSTTSSLAGASTSTGGSVGVFSAITGRDLVEFISRLALTGRVPSRPDAGVAGTISVEAEEFQAAVQAFKLELEHLPPLIGDYALDAGAQLVDSTETVLELLRQSIERRAEEASRTLEAVEVDLGRALRVEPETRIPRAPQDQELFDEILERERELASVQQTRVAALTVAFSSFFSEALGGIDDLGDAFEAFVESLAASLLSQAAGDLASSIIGGFGGGRYHGGPVSAGILYETHGLGQREFFVPASDGNIVTGGTSVTINVAPGVTETEVRRFLVEEGTPLIRAAVSDGLQDYELEGQI